MPYIHNNNAQEIGMYGQELGQSLGQAFLQVPQQRAMMAIQLGQARQQQQQQLMNYLLASQRANETSRYHTEMLDSRNKGLEQTDTWHQIQGGIEQLRAQADLERTRNEAFRTQFQMTQPHVSGGYVTQYEPGQQESMPPPPTPSGPGIQMPQFGLGPQTNQGLSQPQEQPPQPQSQGQPGGWSVRPLPNRGLNDQKPMTENERQERLQQSLSQGAQFAGVQGGNTLTNFVKQYYPGVTNRINQLLNLGQSQQQPNVPQQSLGGQGGRIATPEQVQQAFKAAGGNVQMARQMLGKYGLVPPQ